MTTLSNLKNKGRLLPMRVVPIHPVRLATRLEPKQRRLRYLYLRKDLKRLKDSRNLFKKLLIKIIIFKKIKKFNKKFEKIIYQSY
jgi:hypothetical protein